MTVTFPEAEHWSLPVFCFWESNGHMLQSTDSVVLCMA